MPIDEQPRREHRTASRAVNPRGQGNVLRSEILAAASELLTETSVAQAVTLRGIARRAGIAAPSVYLHFPDRDAILAAVVAQAFTDLGVAMSSATDTGAEPEEQVRSLCRAYVGFAVRNPGRYRVLFDRGGSNLSADTRTYPEGVAVFDLLSSTLTAAVQRGTSDSTDPVGDSATLWTALHGLATLPPATPGFPWARTGDLLERLIDRLARLRPGPTTG